MERAYCLAGALILLCALASRVHAQALTDNDFRVDLSQGLVLSGSRIVGVGGAFTALGTGIDGAAFNPASYAARDMWELKRATWSTTLGVSFPGRFNTDDYFNSADPLNLNVANSFYLDLGLRIQVGYGGGGILGTFQQYTLRGGGESFQVQFGTVYMGVAAAFFRESLILGAGLRVGLFQISRQSVGGRLVSFSGMGPSIGALIRPEGKRFRIGAAIHLPVDSRIARIDAGSPPTQVNGYFLPRSVNLPWQIRAGFAVQLGERPMNIHWTRRPDPEERVRTKLAEQRCARVRAALIEEQERARGASSQLDEGPTRPAEVLPHPATCEGIPVPRSAVFWHEEAARRQAEDESFEERVSEASRAINLERWNAYDALPRRHIILTLDLGVIGPVPNAIGVDAFLEQVRRGRMTNATPTFALGMEAEPLRNRVKLRVGTYLEPARNLNTTFRMHGTGGLDMRLFRWALFPDDPWDFRLGFVFDLARDYTNVGLTFGFWH